LGKELTTPHHTEDNLLQKLHRVSEFDKFFVMTETKENEAGSCDHSDELLSSIKSWKFID
jgi:hypothetical protein